MVSMLTYFVILQFLCCKETCLKNTLRKTKQNMLSESQVLVTGFQKMINLNYCDFSENVYFIGENEKIAKRSIIRII
jgi:hypothetical protein